MTNKMFDFDEMLAQQMRLNESAWRERTGASDMMQAACPTYPAPKI
jgi:hypothetical protein